MFEKKDNSVEKQKLEELKRLKRENRRRCGMFFIAALQISSLIAFYYLGRSSHQKN